MNMPLWIDFSDDPNNRDAKAAVQNWLPTGSREKWRNQTLITLFQNP